HRTGPLAVEPRVGANWACRGGSIAAGNFRGADSGSPPLIVTAQSSFARGPVRSMGGGRMKTASLVDAGAMPLIQARVADYVELFRLKVSLLVLFTVAVGVFLASGSAVDVPQLFHVLFGTALVAAGASALNQLLERHTDALMSRTENRPLPSGRLTPLEVLLLG